MRVNPIPRRRPTPMKMKIDKEALAKNSFWISLGAFGLMWLIAFLTLRMEAAEKGTKLHKDYVAQKKSIDGAASNRPKNYDTYTKPWENQGKDYEDIKAKVWKLAWELQNPADKPFVTWPPSPTNDATVSELLKHPSVEL